MSRFSSAPASAGPSLAATPAGSPVAEEQRLLGGSVVRRPLYFGETEPGQPVRDVSGQVEERMPLPRRRPEEPGAVGVLGGEAGREFRPDFIGRLGDARPDA